MPVINQLAPEVVVPPEEGPCSWPLDTTCIDGWADYSADVQAAATAWATYILWALTGRRYGPCPVTIRPCGPKCSGPMGYVTYPVNASGAVGGGSPWMIPWIDNGLWRNCGCTGGCSCQATCQVALPGPVAEVQEVIVDGVVVDPSAYRLDYVRGIPVLVRTDGLCWPDCQDMDASLTEEGSFGITYLLGIGVPIAGQLAAGQLAGDFARGCTGGACSLPQQLSSLSRNGVEVTVVDPNQILEQGLTGLASVDLWIKSVNPRAKAQPSRVYSLDRSGPRFTL